MTKALTMAMDNDSWNRVRSSGREDSVVVEALYLATRDLVDRLEAIEMRLEAIEEKLADQAGG